MRTAQTPSQRLRTRGVDRPRSRRSPDQRGIALVATLLVMILIAALIAATMTTAMNELRTTNAEYHTSRAFYAAEAAAEKALGDVELALDDGFVDDGELAAITPPFMDGVDFSEFEVVKIDTVYTDPITDGPFNGLYALTQNFEVRAKATDESGAHSAVVLGGKAAAIPIFQFGYFFEGAGGMKWEGNWNGYGRMHSNRGLYFHACGGIFHDILTTPGKARIEGHETHRPRPGGCSPTQSFIDNAIGTPVLLDFDSDDTPDPDQFKAKSIASFDGRLMTDAFGVDSLKLPLPDGVPARELIEPKDGSDTVREKDVKFAWKADMYVTVDLTDLQAANPACGGPPVDPRAPAQLPRITVTRFHGFAAVPDPAWECKIFRFRWESFYDNHEKGWVDVLDLDLTELRNWINSGPGDGTQIIYVEFQNAAGPVVVPGITDRNPEPSNVTLNNAGKYYPVLKLTNGAQLHGPLTVGSEYMVWVQGDYNSGTWYPASVFGEVVGFLSNNWDDANVQLEWSYNDPGGVRYSGGWNCAFVSPTWCPEASQTTTQYYAFISSDNGGILGCYHEDPSCVPASYTRMGSNKWLEGWRYTSTGCSANPGSWCMHFWRGSQVVLYPVENMNQYSNFPGNPYNWYYGSARDWGFDTRFLQPDSLPPGTPLVGAVFRAAFRESY